VSDGSPPQRPPQVSPDGKWVWDGTEWQPVAGRDSGHTAVFPAFNPAALQASMVDPTTPASPTPFGAAPPAVNYAASYSAPQQTSAPLWQVKPGHWNKYLYVVAGVVVLVIAGIFLSSLGPITLPWFASAGPVVSRPGPSELSARTDYAAANRFMTDHITSDIVSLNKTITAQVLSCNGVLTVGCQDAMTVTDGKVQDALAVINTESFPLCLATNVGNVKFQLQRLHGFLHDAFTAYTDSSKKELLSALAGFYAVDHALQLAFNATQAAANVCDTQLTGP
jgi:hypothetical protein